MLAGGGAALAWRAGWCSGSGAARRSGSGSKVLARGGRLMELRDCSAGARMGSFGAANPLRAKRVR